MQALIDPQKDLAGDVFRMIPVMAEGIGEIVNGLFIAADQRIPGGGVTGFATLNQIRLAMVAYKQSYGMYRRGALIVVGRRLGYSAHGRNPLSQTVRSRRTTLVLLSAWSIAKILERPTDRRSLPWAVPSVPA